MAEFRQVHTKMWKDEWFLDLEPPEKLLFIYLFSNELTSVAGIYKLPVRAIAFETGLDLSFVRDTLHRFERDGKIRYENGVMWVKNLRKYNETSSPKVATRIRRDLSLIPEGDLKAEYIAYYTKRDTLSIPYSKSESETDTDTETEKKEVIRPEFPDLDDLTAPAPTALPATAGDKPNGLTVAGKEYFKQFRRKRWATPQQRDTFEQAERDVGTDVMLAAVAWAATKNVTDVGAVAKTARKMAKDNGGEHSTAHGMIDPGGQM
jgi:hypothetical protein